MTVGQWLCELSFPHKSRAVSAGHLGSVHKDSGSLQGDKRTLPTPFGLYSQLLSLAQSGGRLRVDGLEIARSSVTPMIQARSMVVTRTLSCTVLAHAGTEIVGRV